MSDRVLATSSEYRVRYSEVDQMKFMYYGRYLEYFEMARTDMLRRMGLPYTEVEKNGFFLPVLEAHVTYKSPAFYDDVIIVTSMMTGTPAVRLRIDYEVTNKATGKLIATGYTEHAFLNPETQTVTRVPKIFLDALNAYEQSLNN